MTTQNTAPATTAAAAAKAAPKRARKAPAAPKPKAPAAKKAAAPKKAPAAKAKAAPAAAARKGKAAANGKGDTKMDAMIKLCMRKRGASVEELIEATGWEKFPYGWNLKNKVAPRLGLVFEAVKAVPKGEKRAKVRYHLRAA